MEPKDRVTTLTKSKLGAIRERVKGAGQEQGAEFVVDPDAVGAMLEGWPAAPRKVADWAIETYGPPNEATPTMLIWHNNEPWKRTVVFRQEIPHNFPTMHTDFIMQWIDYPVPVDKANDITAFDGSCIIDRTAGEAAARCDMESMNILTLNLMHEIVTGKRTVDEARKVYAEQAAAHVMDRKAEYTERFLFDIPGPGQGDPDERIIGSAMAREAVGKIGDAVSGERGGPDS